MGNVRSQHSKLNTDNRRTSVSSDRPSFYHRRWSSNNKQEDRTSRKNTLSPIDTCLSSPPVNHRKKMEPVNGEKIEDAEPYHRTFRYSKRPKSYPAMPSAKSAQRLYTRHRQNEPISLDYNNSISEDDISRRTQMHYLLKHYFCGKYKAPIQEILRQPSSFLSDHQDKKETNPVRILDICCGNGQWTMEMATEYPDVECYGVNPTEAYPMMVKPSNAHFFCCDVAHNSARLDFPDNHFDFVRMEMIYKSYNKSQWKILVKELSRVLKTGGYFELRDVDPIMKHTGPLGQAFFEQYANIVKEKLDVDMDWYRYMYDYMERYGGMIDIHFQEAMLPLGWGQGQIPQILLRLVRAGLQSHEQIWLDLSDEPDETSSADKDKTNRILDEAVEHHAYYNFYLCWGRKPYFPEIPIVTSPVEEQTQTASVKKESDSEIWALVNGYDE